VFLAVVGATVGYGLSDDLSGVVIPGVPNIVPQGLNTVLTLSSVLALILPFLAGAIAGPAGARTGTRRAGGEDISPWSSGSYRSTTSGSVQATSGAEVYPSESAFAMASPR
jgi:hypothetical protein